MRIPLWSDREERRYLLLFLTITISLTYLHYQFVDYPKADKRWGAQRYHLDGMAESPYRYRILTPELAEIGGLLANKTIGMELRKGVLLSHIMIRAVAIFLILILFQRFLIRWFERREALTGTLMLAALMPLTFVHYVFHPESPLEVISFILGMGLIADRRRGWFCLLLAVSTINRETSVFLIPLYVLCLYGSEPKIRLAKWTFLYGATWIAVYGGLRLALGWAKHVNQDLPNAWTYRLIRNFSSWDSYVTFVALYGVLWWLAYCDFSTKPKIFRRALLFVPVYVVFYLVFGDLHEVRYFWPLCPIIIPPALMSFLGKTGYD